MEAKTNDLWVYIETDDNGKAKNVGIELLTPGRMMANKQGGKLVAVIIGFNVNETVQEINNYGVDQIIVVDAPEYEEYSTDAYTACLVSLVEKYAPTSLLMGATNDGRDLGPRVACRLKTGLTADCTALDVDEESGNVAWTRPAFGGNLMATILCPISRPQIGTIRPGVFKKGEQGEGHAAIIKENIRFNVEKIRTTVLEMIEEMGEEMVNLEEAEIIISGGRGVGGPEGFDMIKILADEIGGVVGSSRAAVDAGWIAHSHQVGQTGKTVASKIYIACGISGAIQHVAGMSGSDCIIAINKDSNAPIFDIADYGVVGDLFEVIPLMVEEMRKAKR
ncbi:Caffeyl-CoA reductase-Etf complex subunit CarE [anaerobic digester metagenome]